MDRDLSESSDEELARATQASSLPAFEELARRYERRIFAFLRQRLPNDSDAEDLTQKTFITAYRKIHLYQHQYRFAPWLFTIARNLRASHYQAAARIPTPAPEREQLDERSPAVVLVEREARASLWAVARAVLSEDQHQALWLHYAEDLKLRDVAVALGTSEANAKVLLHRARRTLAARLTAETEARGAGRRVAGNGGG